VNWPLSSFTRAVFSQNMTEINDLRSPKSILSALIGNPFKARFADVFTSAVMSDEIFLATRSVAYVKYATFSVFTNGSSIYHRHIDFGEV